VIVIQRSHDDVRPVRRPTHNALRTHDGVARSLKHENWKIEPKRVGPVTRRVLVKIVRERHGAVLRVVKYVQPASLLPSGKPLLVQPCESRGAEVQGGRQQNEALNASVDGAGLLTSSRVHGDESPQARSDERHRTGWKRGKRFVNLTQHPRHRQVFEVRLVEVRREDPNAVRREPIAEEDRL
jgi:hypothetical protein